MISLVVPAHNERQAIGRSLSAFGTVTNVEAIVVANGCTDDTAEVARQSIGQIEVVETHVASKVHALNLGDRHATGWPRFYVDADVQLSAESLRKLVERLEVGDVLAVAPRPKHDLAGCSWAVRAFYAVDSRLPSSKEGIGGSGVYGLSEAGRKRFGEFPAVTADDAFVRRQFQPHERATVDDAYSIVTPPKTLAGLVAIKTRSHFGNYELDALYPHLTGNRGASNRPALLRMTLRPWNWPALAVYGYVKSVAKAKARRRFRTGRGPRWERDETSRQPQPAAAGIGTTPS